MHWHVFCLLCVHMNSLNALSSLKSTSFSILIATSSSILKCSKFRFINDQITAKFCGNVGPSPDILFTRVLEKFLCHQARI